MTAFLSCGMLFRGQQIKVTAQLLRKCRQLQYVVPSVKVSGPHIANHGRVQDGWVVRWYWRDNPFKNIVVCLRRSTLGLVRL